MKVTKTQQIRKLLLAFPELTTEAIAQQTRTTKAAVYSVRYKLKKQQAKGIESIPTFIEKPKVTAKYTPKHDAVNHPSHYTKGGIETIDFIKAKLTPAEYKGFLKGNLIKYVSRAGLKGDEVEDFGKIKFYSEELAQVN